jgi:hypothetical protein
MNVLASQKDYAILSFVKRFMITLRVTSTREPT